MYSPTHTAVGAAVGGAAGEAEQAASQRREQLARPEVRTLLYGPSYNSSSSLHLNKNGEAPRQRKYSRPACQHCGRCVSCRCDRSLVCDSSPMVITQNCTRRGVIIKLYW